MDRLLPTVRPLGRPIGFQRWRHLLFLHWAVPVEALRPLVPSGLEIDTWDDLAWIGVVPFTMRDVSPWWSPSVPGISNFHELNVRTYVHRGGADPGVVFFSLDAASSLAVVLARLLWHLPYFRASMEMAVEGSFVTYRSRRLWPAPRPADLTLSYRFGDGLGPAAPGSFEHFLAERYLLYTQHAEQLLVGRVHHRPYPLHPAELISLSQDLSTAADLPPLTGPPHLLYSPGVDVDIFPLRPV